MALLQNQEVSLNQKETKSATCRPKRRCILIEGETEDDPGQKRSIPENYKSRLCRPLESRKQWQDDQPMITVHPCRLT
jgi:hypothetical protein